MSNQNQDAVHEQGEVYVARAERGAPWMYYMVSIAAYGSGRCRASLGRLDQATKRMVFEDLGPMDPPPATRQQALTLLADAIQALRLADEDQLMLW